MGWSDLSRSQDQGIITQGFECHRFMPGSRMTRRKHDQHRFGCQAMQFYGIAVGSPLAQEDGIKLFIHQCMQKAGGIVFFQRHFNTGIGPAEITENAWDAGAKRSGCGKAHPDRADFTATGALCGANGAFRQLREMLHDIAKGNSGLGQFRAMRDTVKQLGADFGFKIADLLA